MYLHQCCNRDRAFCNLNPVQAVGGQQQEDSAYCCEWTQLQCMYEPLFSLWDLHFNTYTANIYALLIVSSTSHVMRDSIHEANAPQQCSTCSCKFACLFLSDLHTQHTLERSCEGVILDACRAQCHLSSSDSGWPDCLCPAHHQHVRLVSKQALSLALHAWPLH